MQLDSVESIKVLVAGGLGAWIVPRLALTRPLASTVTRRLRPALSRHLTVAVRLEKVLDRGLRVMIEALREVGHE